MSLRVGREKERDTEREGGKGRKDGGGSKNGEEVGGGENEEKGNKSQNQDAVIWDLLILHIRPFKPFLDPSRFSGQEQHRKSNSKSAPLPGSPRNEQEEPWQMQPPGDV